MTNEEIGRGLIVAGVLVGAILAFNPDACRVEPEHTPEVGPRASAVEATRGEHGGPIAGAELRRLSEKLLKIENAHVDRMGRWVAVATVRNSTGRSLGAQTFVVCTLFDSAGSALQVAQNIMSGDEILPGERLSVEVSASVDPRKPIARADCQLE